MGTYDEWKASAPEGDDVHEDGEAPEPACPTCARHVGEVRPWARYSPCGEVATYRVAAHKWPACSQHAAEAAELGSSLEPIEVDGAADTLPAPPALTPNDVDTVLSLVLSRDFRTGCYRCAGTGGGCRDCG